MPKRMWFNNPTDKEVKRRSNRSFLILSGCEDIDRNMVFKLKEVSVSRGHEVTLVKEPCRLDMKKYFILTEDNK